MCPGYDQLNSKLLTAGLSRAALRSKTESEICTSVSAPDTRSTPAAATGTQTDQQSGNWQINWVGKSITTLFLPNKRDIDRCSSRFWIATVNLFVT